MRSISAAVAAAHPAPTALLSSCQRIEVYHQADCGCAAPLHLSGSAALAHLSEVAAGLHSVVLGEREILGQVRKAMSSTDSSLNRQAALAVAAARDLRSETAFDAHTGHLLDRGLRLTGTVAAGRILILGAGVTARAVARRAAQIGFAAVSVAARVHPEGEWFDSAAYEFFTLGEVAAAPPQDVLVACLGSGAAELDAANCLPIVRSLIIDLGTPRNFGGTAPVRLIDIAEMEAAETGESHSLQKREELRARLQTHLQRRLGLAAEDSSTSLGLLRRNVEEVRQSEAARARRLHPDISPEFIDTLTHALVNQIFHLPTQRLRAANDRQLADDLAALFNPSPAFEKGNR
ncbi:MAG: hypothetical protein ABIP13_11615 [Tepidiformaceae bacterium]